AAVRRGAEARHDRIALYLSAARRRNTWRQVPGVGCDLHHDARADHGLPSLHLQHPLVSAVSAARGLPRAAAVFLDSQLERGGVYQLVARIAARVLVVRSVRQLRQGRDRSRSRYLLHLFHRLLSVSHAALDGGTQVDRPALKESPTAGRRSIWMNYAVLVYTVIAFGAVLFVANAIISTRNLRWDLTPSKRYSLSDFDKRVLGGLTHNVKVMAFVRTEDASYLELADLLFQAAVFTPRLTYQVIDVNKAPGLAREYGVSSYGEVVVESQGRRRDFDNSRSDELIPAVLQVSSEANKHIYFTIGHGERDLFDSDRSLGYSQWRGLLEQNNYQI